MEFGLAIYFKKYIDLWLGMRVFVLATMLSNTNASMQVQLDASKVVEVVGNDIANEFVTEFNTFSINNSLDQSVKILLESIPSGEGTGFPRQVNKQTAKLSFTQFWATFKLEAAYHLKQVGGIL
jgi:hypothetical protein